MINETEDTLEAPDQTLVDSTEATDNIAAKADDTLEEEDPWAAALAEQGVTQEQDQKQVEENPKPDPGTGSASHSHSVRDGSAEAFPPLSAGPAKGSAQELDLIMNIPVKLNVELGRTRISIRQLLELAQGSVLELDGLAGDPMDILINGYLIAQGEVVVVEDKYGIRITDIITPTERVEKLNR
ncbi:flagellar motor switch protein FliN [Halioglobus sp. HI00S01]|uniref:flagellar motor switch protein FliN n=1 Tax=Halioglobus sp. HI00S01 TaxID=1822214 RepID=UPI000A3EF342